ncbi:hypothetical protein PHYC_00935 [Phycisphaerales bacterium]|nr:hypothetical protein PHYC_00935 [Phycisphaerales bacterium]
MTERQAIADSAASGIERAVREHRLPTVLVGFDGFIDSIVKMVDYRRSMKVEDFEPLRTISAFAQRCAAAAGKSANIERVTLQDRFGGNGPLMAGALAGLGAGVTFVGAVGDGAGAVHPVFAPFASRCATCIPVGVPSHTLCLEFDDGKLMFNDTANVQAVTWERVAGSVGHDALRAMVAQASLIGVVNWSLLGGVEGMWEGLRQILVTRPGPHADRRVFIDLSDPAKRLDEDITRAMQLLRRLEDTPGVSVTLGLNLSEAQRMVKVLGLPGGVPRGAPHAGEGLVAAASGIRGALSLDTVVIHPREGAAAANSEGSWWFEGPFTDSPNLSTGAGDHFNAGFAFAQVLNLSPPECLAAGCAVSGAYVRDANSPTLERLCGFLRNLPLSDRS